MAVNDKDPTDAISLVEQTVNTFNQIVVGQEGQMVPVPGYPDQPTLAERVKQNLKPSTDAAAGFASQAAASAKAADDSAKLASQISGLDTVAAAVGMAAVPFPDVWAPLSDSLRLICGYGREVKVGEDVVARYLNFSRMTAKWYHGKNGVLQQAAINEPAFERKGLRIDPASTNLLLQSKTLLGVAWSKNALLLATPNHAIAPDGTLTACRFSPEAGSSPTAGVYVGQSVTKSASATEYTFSVYVKSAGAGRIRVMLSGENTTVERLTLDVDPTTGSLLAWSYGTGTGFTTAAYSSEVVAYGWRRISITTTTDAASQLRVYIYSLFQGGEVPDGVAGLNIWGAQLEAQPFMTSYIPTDGSAVTRASDICSLPGQGNLPLSAISISAEFSVAGPYKFFRQLVSIRNQSGLTGNCEVCIPSSTVRPRVVATDGVVSETLDGIDGASSFAVAIEKGRLAIASAGVITTRPIGTPIFAAGDAIGVGKGSSDTSLGGLCGHLRNIRVWHRALTDAQLASIR